MIYPKIYKDWKWHAYFNGVWWDVLTKDNAIVAKEMTKEVANLVANLPEILRRIDSIENLK